MSCLSPTGAASEMSSFTSDFGGVGTTPGGEAANTTGEHMLEKLRRDRAGLESAKGARRTSDELEHGFPVL